MSMRIVNPISPLAMLAQRPAVHVGLGATLGEAALVMESHSVTAVLVGDGIQGILTEGDLTRGLAAGLGADDPVAPLVSRTVLFARPGTSVVEGASLMLNEEIRHLVVDAGEGVFAVVSLREVMAALLQAVEPHLWLTSLRLAIVPAPE